MEFLITQRGQRAVIFGGRSFCLKETFKNGNKRWSCRSSKCKGSLLTSFDETIVIKEGDHSCAPDDAKIAIEKIKDQGKKICREELTPIPTIHKEIFSPALNQGLDLVVNVPDLNFIKSSMYRYRREALGCSSPFAHRRDLIIGEKYTDGFLMADRLFDDNRIIIFGSENGLKCLENASEVFGDGTFKSCPRQFAQVYSLHVDIGSTLEVTKIVPCLYAFLPNKSQCSYERLFSIIKEKLPLWSPNKLKIDYEVAVINATVKCLPSVEVKGCNFHFNQSLIRKIQNLGLINEYRGNPEFQSLVRKCSALAHISPDSLDDGWLAIMEDAPATDAATKFSDYMVEQWLENETIGLMWNCYGERHRTTNAVEGWHSKLNKAIGKSHPNILEVIFRLKEDAHFYDLVRAKNELNLPQQKRLRRYRCLDLAIKKSVEDYEKGDISIKECLKKLGYLIKF